MNMKNISYSIVQNIKLDILSIDLDKFLFAKDFEIYKLQSIKLYELHNSFLNGVS